MRQQYSKRMTTTLKSADCKPRSCKSINMQQPVIQKKLFCCKGKLVPSLRSRRLEVAGERENGHARGRHARGEGASSPLACLLLARPFFLVPTTSKRLLRRLASPQRKVLSTQSTANLVFRLTDASFVFV